MTFQPVQEEEIEIDLRKLFFALLHRWHILLLSIALGAALLAGYHAMFVKNAYKATADIYVTDLESSISMQDLQFGNAMTEDYKAIITSRQVLNSVIERLHLDISAEKLQKMISVDNPKGTHILQISVTTQDIELSQKIVNELTNVAVERVSELFGNGKITVVDYADENAILNVMPSRKKYLLIGGLIGLILTSAVICLYVLFKDSITSDEDIKKYLGLPMLAAIPHYREDKRA